MAPTEITGVSLDTLQRVERACEAASLASWDSVASMCCGGVLISVDFSERRPATFVKEFAALVRSFSLKLDADRNLDLFLGSAIGLSQLGMRDNSVARLALTNLGHVSEYETGSMPLSAARRSAGISYTRRPRPLCLNGRTALVLDDELIARKVLTAALSKNGCAVDAVGEAEVALSLMQQRKHDVIILDINLGGCMNGFDFCRALRSNPAFSKLPVIFVSGYSKSDPVVQNENYLGSAYFEKPVKPAHLRDQIMQLL